MIYFTQKRTRIIPLPINVKIILCFIIHIVF